MRGYVELFNLGKTYETPKGPAVIVKGFELNMPKGSLSLSWGTLAVVSRLC